VIGMVEASSKLPAIRAALLRYYDAHARDLPWRRTRDPYAIWVSEIMLQQTRVDTVIAYYERFLRRFPSALALAEASEDDVLASWSGLGYYRRARMLHAGVRDVVARYGGEVPSDAESRRSLPGVAPRARSARSRSIGPRPSSMATSRAYYRGCSRSTPRRSARTPWRCIGAWPKRWCKASGRAR
jgi:adenine-specific DNA glycosylase